jgi:hypothetical protein
LSTIFCLAVASHDGGRASSKPVTMGSYAYNPRLPALEIRRIGFPKVLDTLAICQPTLH